MNFDARGYLIRNVLHRNTKPLPDLEGVCTQIDHETAFLRSVIREAFEDMKSGADASAFAILKAAQPFSRENRTGIERK